MIGDDETSVQQVSHKPQQSEVDLLDEVSDSETDEEFDVEFSSDDEIFEAENEEDKPMRLFDYDSIAM